MIQEIKIYPDYNLITDTDNINLYVTLETNIKIGNEFFQISQKNILKLIDLYNLHEFIPALEKRLDFIVLDKYQEIKSKETESKNFSKLNFNIAEKYKGTRLNNRSKRDYEVTEEVVDKLFDSYEQEVEQKLRQTGRSTRLLDSYVQELFEKGFVEIIDHHNTIQSNTLLFGKLVQRLTNEHKWLRFEITYPNKIKLK